MGYIGRMRGRGFSANKPKTAVMVEVRSGGSGGPCRMLASSSVIPRRALRRFASFTQGLTLVPISAQLELVCPPYNPTHEYVLDLC